MQSWKHHHGNKSHTKSLDHLSFRVWGFIVWIHSLLNGFRAPSLPLWYVLAMEYLLSELRSTPKWDFHAGLDDLGSEGDARCRSDPKVIRSASLMGTVSFGNEGSARDPMTLWILVGYTSGSTIFCAWWELRMAAFAINTTSIKARYPLQVVTLLRYCCRVDGWMDASHQQRHTDWQRSWTGMITLDLLLTGLFRFPNWTTRIGKMEYLNRVSNSESSSRWAISSLTSLTAIQCHSFAVRLISTFDTNPRLRSM